MAGGRRQPRRARARSALVRSVGEEAQGLANGRGDEGFAACDEEAGAWGLVAGLDGGEGDGSRTEHGGDGGTGDGADGFAGVVEWSGEDGGPGLGLGRDEVAFAGERGGLWFEEEGDEPALGMAAGVHAGDDFLPEVAPLGEGDAVGEEAGFVGKGVGREVEVEEGASGLDAGDVVGVPADGADTGVGEEGRADDLGGCGGEGEFEADHAGGVVAIDDALVPGDGEDGGVVGFERRRGGEACGGSQRVEGEGPVEGEAVEGVGTIVEGDLVGDDEGGERGGGGRGDEGVGVEEEAVGEVEEAEVGVDSALAVEPEGTACTEGLEVLERLGDHAVEEGEAVGPAGLDDGAVGEVEEGGVLAERGVFEFDVIEDRWDEDVALGRPPGEEEGVGVAVHPEDGGGVRHGARS